MDYPHPLSTGVKGSSTTRPYATPPSVALSRPVAARPGGENCWLPAWRAGRYRRSFCETRPARGCSPGPRENMCRIPASSSLAYHGYEPPLVLLVRYLRRTRHLDSPHGPLLQVFWANTWCRLKLVLTDPFHPPSPFIKNFLSRVHPHRSRAPQSGAGLGETGLRAPFFHAKDGEAECVAAPRGALSCFMRYLCCRSKGALPRVILLREIVAAGGDPRSALGGALARRSGGGGGASREHGGHADPARGGTKPV